MTLPHPRKMTHHANFNDIAGEDAFLTYYGKKSRKALSGTSMRVATLQRMVGVANWTHWETNGISVKIKAPFVNHLIDGYVTSNWPDWCTRNNILPQVPAAQNAPQVPQVPAAVGGVGGAGANEPTNRELLQQLVQLLQQQQQQPAVLQQQQQWVLLGVAITLVIDYCIGSFHGQVRYGDQHTGHNLFATWNELCPCHAVNNETCTQCQPCVDRYLGMQHNQTECMQHNHLLQRNLQRLQNEIEALQQDIIRPLRNECKAQKQNMAELEQQLDGCELETKELQAQGNADCHEYKDEVETLKHELGECHVEWGACKQRQRLQDKLDEQRLQEIEKQKRKFSMCNEQLRKLKSETKSVKTTQH